MRWSCVLVLTSCAGTADVQKPVEPAPAPASTPEPAPQNEIAGLPVLLEDPWDPWDWAPDPVKARPALSKAPTQRPAPAWPGYELPDVIAMPIADEKLVKTQPGKVMTGMHSDVITDLVVSEDGKLAVTVDRQGGARLWPAFDGTREPVILPLRARRSLAVTRIDNDLAIAGLDEIGQLELLRVRATGEAVQRSPIKTRRPLVLLRATSKGFVGVLDDRAVVVLDGAGKLRGELVGDTGHHVANVTVRRDRALALVESEGKIRGRWIDLATAAWGDTTGVLPIDGTHVAMSPDHMRIAGVQDGGKRLVIAKLATGAVLAKPWSEEFADPTVRPIGYTDKGTLLWTQGEELFWWQRGGSDPANLFRTVAAVGGEQVISASDRWLQITTGSKTEYLGYRLGGPYQLHASSKGFLVNDGISIVELDKQLTTEVVHEMPQREGMPYSLGPAAALDARHVLGLGYTSGKHGVYVIDLDTKQAKLILKGRAIEYNAATGLASFYDNDGAIEMMRWNPKTKSFGEAVEIPDTRPAKGRAQSQVMHVDPALAGGAAFVVFQLDYEQHAEWTYYRAKGDDALTLEEIKRGKKTVTHDWLDVHPLTDLVPARMRGNRKHSPNGKLVVELTDSRITLRDKKGTELWTVARLDAMHVSWTPSGELVAWGAGIARLDLATGEVRECKCGWRFGRWSRVPEGWGSSKLCEATQHF